MTETISEPLPGTSPETDTAALPTLHMIGNAHIDPVWLWRWQEGVAEAIGTCWAAIDRLEESDAFVFTKGEAQVYAWIEDLDPSLFARIRHFVAEGRWVIVNGWWVQPDCNIPSGESVIRQALYGRRYFRSRFGVEVTVGYNVDSFGHAGTLPMLLRHTGFSRYVFSRPAEDEMHLPRELFLWASPDGSEVAAFRIQGAYNTSKRNMQLPEKVPLHYGLSAAAGHSFMLFYGVGNHGGAPTRENLRQIDARIAAGEPLTYSDPDHFFDAAVTPGLPRVEGELQFHAVGCYAAASRLKQLNRRAEAALEQAETAAALAMRSAGAPYPRAAFEAMWRRLLFNQFHDTLGGTSLHSACDDSALELGAVVADAEVTLNAAVRRLAAGIAPSDDPTAGTFVVMNFNAEPYDGLIEAEPWVDKDVSSPRSLLDDRGAVVPLQHVDPHGKTPGLQRLAFRGRIPAFGYRVYRFATDPEGVVSPGMIFGRAAGRLTFETPGWRLRIDPETGAIAELFSAALGGPVFAGPGHRALIVEDGTDTWGHGTHRFALIGADLALESVTLIDEGPLRTTLQVVSARGATRMATVIVLPADPDLPVELRVDLDWQEKGRLMRLAYPLEGRGFEYEVPAGWQGRSDSGHEVPGLRWVRVETAGGAVGIANDAKYSYAALDGTLYLTAVRSPVFAHHDPVALPEGAFLRHMDLGPQSFTLRFLADQALGRRRVQALADALTKPPLVTTHVARGGSAPHAGSWLEVDAGPSTAVTTLKAAEEADEVILRAVELDGVPGAVGLGGEVAAVPPRGIATLRLRGGTLVASDGLEG